MNVVIAFGNPLLDTTININSDVLLKKHNLKSDGQKEVSENEMKRLLHDIQSYDEERSAGGCAQNTLRILQWLFRHRCSTTIFGSIGKDEQGQVLRELLEKDGVRTRYIEHENLPTGTTVALINGVYRSLVAHLGAAENLPLEALTSNHDVDSHVKATDLVYIEGFFLTNRVETARFVLNQCSKHQKPLAFNLSGQYLCEMDPDNVKYFAENSDILFGNLREFQALALATAISVDNFVMGLSRRKQGKVIVITDGAKTVRCVHSGGAVEEIAVPPVAVADIVDTTGAGDAFVAGFLAGWILRRAPSNCSELGCYAAQEVIRRRGCTLPQHLPNVLLI